MRPWLRYARAVPASKPKRTSSYLPLPNWQLPPPASLETLIVPLSISPEEITHNDLITITIIHPDPVRRLHHTFRTRTATSLFQCGNRHVAQWVRWSRCHRCLSNRLVGGRRMVSLDSYVLVVIYSRQFALNARIDSFAFVA